MKASKLLNSWLPVFLWCTVIFFLSSIPTIQTSRIYFWDFVLKKTAHIVEYGLLYFLVFRALEEEGVKNKKWIIPFIFGLIYGISDEYHQRFVSGRHSRVMDLGFDFLGMLLAFYWLKKYGLPEKPAVSC